MHRPYDVKQVFPKTRENLAKAGHRAPSRGPPLRLRGSLLVVLLLRLRRHQVRKGALHICRPFIP
eukprot:scaffold213_cov245-Pinguiococcus_pyrenoidosus.AAC.31